jgi:hypothetical protein
MCTWWLGRNKFEINLERFGPDLIRAPPVIEVIHQCIIFHCTQHRFSLHTRFLPELPRRTARTATGAMCQWQEDGLLLCGKKSREVDDGMMSCYRSHPLHSIVIFSNSLSLLGHGEIEANRKAQRKVAGEESSMAREDQCRECETRLMGYIFVFYTHHDCTLTFYFYQLKRNQLIPHQRHPRRALVWNELVKERQTKPTPWYWDIRGKIIYALMLLIWSDADPLKHWICYRLDNPMGHHDGEFDIHARRRLQEINGMMDRFLRLHRNAPDAEWLTTRFVGIKLQDAGAFEPFLRLSRDYLAGVPVPALRQKYVDDMHRDARPNILPFDCRGRDQRGPAQRRRPPRVPRAAYEAAGSRWETRVVGAGVGGPPARPSDRVRV